MSQVALQPHYGMRSADPEAVAQLPCVVQPDRSSVAGTKADVLTFTYAKARLIGRGEREWSGPSRKPPEAIGALPGRPADRGRDRPGVPSRRARVGLALILLTSGCGAQPVDLGGR